MARIRTIKPEFWCDEKASRWPPLTRLVFLALISLADDKGRLVDNVKMLDGQIFPNTDDTCAGALDTLARESRVIRYEGPSGQRLLQIANWAKHQKVDKPGRVFLPAPLGYVEPAPSLSPHSRDSREGVAPDSPPDLGPGTKDRGPSTRDRAFRAPRAAQTAGTKLRRAIS